MSDGTETVIMPPDAATETTPDTGNTPIADFASKLLATQEATSQDVIDTAGAPEKADESSTEPQTGDKPDLQKLVDALKEQKAQEPEKKADAAKEPDTAQGTWNIGDPLSIEIKPDDPMYGGLDQLQTALDDADAKAVALESGEIARSVVNAHLTPVVKQLNDSLAKMRQESRFMEESIAHNVWLVNNNPELLDVPNLGKVLNTAQEIAISKVKPDDADPFRMARVAVQADKEIKAALQQLKVVKTSAKPSSAFPQSPGARVTESPKPEEKVSVTDKALLHLLGTK